MVNLNVQLLWDLTIHLKEMKHVTFLKTCKQEFIAPLFTTVPNQTIKHPDIPGQMVNQLNYINSMENQYTS